MADEAAEGAHVLGGLERELGLGHLLGRLDDVAGHAGVHAGERVGERLALRERRARRGREQAMVSASSDHGSPPPAGGPHVGEPRSAHERDPAGPQSSEL